MPTLTLHLRPNRPYPKLISHTEFSRENAYIGPDQEITAEGALALCLLCIRAAQERNGERDLPSVPVGLVRKLWETARAPLPPHKRDRPYLLKIFGEDPYNRFLFTSGSSKNPVVSFADDLEISIVDEDGEPIESVDEDGEPNNLYSAINQAIDCISESPPDLELYINVYPPGDRRSATVRSVTGLPSDPCLREHERFEIVLRSGANEHVCLLWVDSLGTVTPLYPEHPSLDIQTPKPVQLDAGRFQLTVPQDDLLLVDTPRGVETCVLLVRSTPFRGSDLKKIASIFQQSRPPVSNIKKPRMICCHNSGINAPRQEPAKTRISKDTSAEEWVVDLLGVLGSDIESARILQIPNLSRRR